MKRTLLSSLLTALCLSLATHVSAVEIIGHRGAAHDAPENTMASFRKSWEQGADADELDIYLTKDGKIVVLHDNNTKRTTGVEGIPSQMTLAELQALDAGLWKGAEWKGEKLPALSDVLTIIPENRRLFIEIKCGVEVLPELKRVIEASGKKPAQLALIGFNYATMQAAKALLPQLETYWIVGSKPDKKTGEVPALATLISKAKAAHLDGLDLQGDFPIDTTFAKAVKDAGLKLYTWTVDDPVRAKQLREVGVDGITTNRPGWLREQLGGSEPKTK